MDKARSMIRNQNHDDDASSRNRIKTFDDGGVTPWLDVNNRVLNLVMMHLGVVDYLAFSGVCKKWRSLALSKMKRFMASKQPLSISFSPLAYEKTCYLEDFEGRRLKTILPHSVGKKCVGLTCGYLIFFGEETHDFWLVNPITRHELYFPDYPCPPPYLGIKAILAFSPSMSGWLFAITAKNQDQLWYSMAGKGVWNNVSTTSHILDLHAFKGKIYTLNIGYSCIDCMGHLCEMTFGTEPKLVLLETKNFPWTACHPEFVSSSENLYVMEYISGDFYKVHELDFGEMEWVYHKKTKEEYAFYRNHMDHITAVKRESWAGADKSQKDRFNTAYMYFPHECLDVNLIDK